MKVTLSGIREQYIKNSKNSGGRLFALFEPRSATSRRKVFQNDYVKAFSESNYVCIAKPFDQSKINEADRFSSAELVADMTASGLKAHEFEGADQIVEYVKKEACPGDVVVIMSNGAFDGIYQKLLKALA